MISRRLLAVVVGSSALLLLGAVPVKARAVNLPSHARIVSELRVAEGGPLRESLELTVPLSGPLQQKLATLRRTPPDPLDVYDERLEGLLGLLTPMSDVQLAAVVSAQEEPPQLQVADDVATLKLDLLYPMLWEVKESGSLRFAPIPLAGETRLAVVLHAPTMGVDAAAPLPVADDGAGNLRWVFEGSGMPSVDVTLHRSLAGPGGEAAQGAASFLIFILPLLVFAVLLVSAPRPWDEGARASLRMCAGIGIAAVGAASFFGILEWQVIDSNVLFTITEETVVMRFLKVFVPAVGIAAFAATPPAPNGRAAARGGFGLILGLILASCVNRLNAIHFDPEFSDSSWPYEFIGAIAAVLLLCLTVDTVLLWLDHIWTKTERGRKVRLALFGTRGRTVTALVVSITAVVQAIFATDWASGPALELLLASTPLSVCNLLLIASVPLFSLSVLSLIWERAAKKNLSFRSPWEGLMIGLVIATSVIGLIGTVDGYPAPVPFLISLLSVGGALYLLANGSRASLTRIEMTPKQTDLLLDHWLSLRALAPGVSGPAQQGEEGERRREQRRSSLDQPELIDIEEEAREREMLDLGLGSARSAAERLRLVADYGWLILVIPIVYSALLLIDQEGRSAASNQQLGLLFLLAAVFAQSAMWLLAVASFVLVYPLLPGRLGVLKGLIAGVFVGLPWLIVQPLGGDQIGLHATYFIPAVLTLLFGAVGLFLDFRTIRRRHEDVKQLSEIYGLTRVRAAFVAIPVLILVFTVIQSLANGQGATALSNAASNLPRTLP